MYPTIGLPSLVVDQSLQQYRHVQVHHLLLVILPWPPYNVSSHQALLSSTQYGHHDSLAELLVHREPPQQFRDVDDLLQVHQLLLTVIIDSPDFPK